jgi:hypothetical protein
VCDFLAKYHFKPAHTCTPVLCLDATQEVFQDIQLRLHKKGVVSVDGCIGPQFDENHFFRQPLEQGRGGNFKREFSLRILRWETNGTIMAHHKSDDLFILGENCYTSLDTQDVCVEALESTRIKEIAFITGVANEYE